MQDLEHPFVEQLGRVESLDDFYGKLDIALVPMTFSTGLKIKVGEALAYGIPIIAHKHAYEGYPVYHDWQVMESIEDIAMAIIDSAQDYQKVEHLRMASENAQLALHSEVSATLDHFVYAVKEQLNTALVVLPKLESGDYSLEKLRVEHVIKNLNIEHRIILYYPYALTTDVQIFLEEKSNLEMIACSDETIVSNQIWTGVDLSTIHKAWQFDILWNLSDLAIEKNDFDKDFYYFDDNSLNTVSEKTVDKDCNVLVQSVMANKSTENSYLDWYDCPLSGRIEDIYEGLWQELPAEESQTIYMLMSGTKEQILFWHKVYSLMFADRYNLCWIIDSDDVNWHIENSVDPLEVSKDYLLLKDPARCGIMVNMGRSNLISSIAWTLFICKRRVYDAEEVSIDQEGQMKLSTHYKEMISSVEKLDLNNYNNRFQHNAYPKYTFNEIHDQLYYRKIGLNLHKKEKNIIIFIAIGRTGSNYLFSLLDNDLPFINAYELYHNKCVYALTEHLSEYMNYTKKDFKEICDLKLVNDVHQDPEKLINFFKNKIENNTKKEFFTFKVFPEHLEFEKVIDILKRDDVNVVFLKRTPIDSYISELKAIESGKWKNKDHTSIKPRINFYKYVQWYERKDKWYADINNFLIKYNKKAVTLHYEKFTESDDATNLQYILSKILDNTGYENKINNFEVKLSMKKQDKNTKVEERVENWDEFYALSKEKGWEEKLFSHFNE